MSADPATAFANFAALREAVLDDSHLLRRLRPVEDERAYVGRIVALGAERGLSFDADTVRAALCAGEQRWPITEGAVTRSTVAGRLFAWTPLHLGLRDGAPWLDWCHLDARRAIEPCFCKTVAQAMREPFNLAFAQSTPIEALEALPPGLPVAGLVFHAGCCGSTLVAQTLAAFESNIVVAEAQPFDAALRLAPEVGEARAASWVAGLANAYAQQRFSYERRSILTFAPADAHGIALIRRALPDVPWVVLTRDPAAVLDRAGGLILDRAALPEALWTTLPAHFGLRLDEGATAAVRAMAAATCRADATGTGVPPSRAE